jgi:hypothetical protein
VPRYLVSTTRPCVSSFDWIRAIPPLSRRGFTIGADASVLFEMGCAATFATAWLGSACPSDITGVAGSDTPVGGGRTGGVNDEIGDGGDVGGGGGEWAFLGNTHPHAVCRSGKRDENGGR